MSKKSVLKMSALAVAIATAAPMTATAEISGSLDIASQYLWRGQTLLTAGTVSGSIDYGHSSGAYAGVWASSESDKNEYDLYAGYAGELDALSYDFGVVSYHYTGARGTGNGPDELNFQELYLSFGMGDFGLSAYIGVGEYGDGADAVDNKDNYYSLSYGKDKFGALLGYYSFDDSDSDYTHIDLSYTVIDNLTFTASKIVDEKVKGTYNDELQFVVAYSFPF
jgi:uncharacterized protein (TIGR02001 family)